MSTTSLFSAMLKQYAPNEIFRNELLKMDWCLSTFERDETWKGGELLVPFKAGTASGVKVGSLLAEADIGSSKYVKGTISSQPEAWGSLIFNEKDLVKHGKINEQNFLKLLPREIEDFTMFMKNVISISFMNGENYAKGATTGGTLASGIVKVDKVERFEINQRIMLKDDVVAATQYFVKSIDLNNETVTLTATLEGAAADLAAAGYSQAANMLFFIEGMETAGNRFTNLRSSLLSAANGGSATLYGQTKLAYPYLQSINIDGSGISATNILAELFTAQTKVRQKGKGNPNIAVMSWKHLGSILAVLEAQKGSFRQASELKASLYNWSEIEVVGVKGVLKIVAVQEMDDDVIFILDKSAIKIYSDGFVRKRVDPDTGREYFTVRSTSGYKYIVDLCFYGDLVLEIPQRCGIIYGIDY